VEVLRGVDLDVEPGESVAIVGPSGSGKTTLLQIVGALDAPDAGTVHVEGRDLAQLSEPERNAFRGRRIGFVFQLHHLLPQLTVLENALVPAWATGNARACLPEALRLIERVGLRDRANHRPGQLSGGERQRAALVRALVLKPALVLADEPTGSLDRAGAADLAGLLVDIQRALGTTWLVATHSPELADRLDRRLRLEAGRLQPA
jgi:lipoprotein-releasing system ATP-binding protein